jgi:hypothetical protein
MDFLTRLAQRLTGEPPAVEPRLPQRFEPAGIAPQAAPPADEISFSAFERAAPSLAGVPAPHAVPIGRISAQPDPGTSTQPSHPPIGMIESAGAEPPRATGDNREFADPPPDLIPGTHRRRPPQAPAPLKRAPVEVQPAAISRAQPAPAIGTRRDARGPLADRSQQRRSVSAFESGPTPPTVHVHIGRVEVRAMMPPAASSQPAARPPAPRPTLEDYLSGRKGGSQP